MKFYIDTANVDEIRRANDMGIIAGAVSYTHLTLPTKLEV